MARLSTYAIDGTPVSSDKLIGTDSAGTVTKNYPLGDVADWLKSSGATAVLGQNNYLFQIALDPDEGRKIGSFSFENYGGDGTAFEDVTNLKFSASSSAGKYIADYLLSTVDQKIMLSQLDDPNSFGIYVLASLVQSPLEPTFYDATLAVVSSNGILRGNKSYGLATYSALNEAGGGTWGSVTGTITNQTDLVDYIDAEIAAIPTPATPTLQSVTDEGNTTTNPISAGTITANNELHLVNSAMRIFRSGDDMRLRTNNSDAMTITANGNVGIGTTAPSYPLHVVGNSLVTGTQFIGDTFTRIQQGSGNLILSNSSSDGSVVLRTNSVEQMRLTSAGRVGIGTTNPISKLELQDGTFTVDNGNIDVFFGGISIDRNSANNTALKVNQRGTADIFALQDDGTDVLTIIDGGNVGIGTTEPGSTLPSDAESGSKILQLTGVSGSAGDTAILLRSLDNSSGFDLWHNASSGDSYIDNRYFYGDTIFRVRTASTPNEVVRITPDGNVGIGTTAPGYPLHIVASNNSTVLGLDAGSAARFRFAGNSTSGYTSTFNIDDIGLDIGHDSTARSLNLKTGNQDRLTILGAGNVGIGTTAPDSKLTVAQSADSNGIKIIGFDDRSADNLTIHINSSGSGEILSNTGVRVNSLSGPTSFLYNGSLMLQIASTSVNVRDDVELAFGNDKDYSIGYNTADDTFRIVDGSNLGSNTRLLINSSGNVGIGNTAPDEKLRVEGNIKSAGDFIGSAVRLGFAGTANITTYDTNEDLLINPNGSGNILMQTTSGNVGIGTTAPGSKLDVSGNIKASLYYVGNSANYIDVSSGLRLRGDSNGINFAPNGSEAMRILASGNVGIGTTAPDDRLTIAGGNVSTKHIGYATDALKISHNSNDVVLSLYKRSSQSLPDVQIRTNGNSYINGGNVGIGTTSPAAKLDVVGTIKLDDGGGSVYVGNAAGYNDDATFNYNVGIGDNALAANTGGNNNIAVGSYALYNPTNTSGNIAIGGSALGDTTTGYRNTAVGHLAHSLNTSGYENVAIGHNALGSATSPYFNVAVGSYALGNASGVASDNTGVGYYAMALLTTGRYNTSLGTYALSDTELGSNNTAVGYYAGGGDYQGTNSVYLGMNTSPNSWNETNQIVIGYGATGNGSNSVTIGNTSITKTIMQEGVGVGVTSPTSAVHIDGAAMRQLRINTPGGPTSSADTTGNIGDIAYDNDFFYIKTANGWGRVQLDFGF